MDKYRAPKFNFNFSPLKAVEQRLTHHLRHNMGHEQQGETCSQLTSATVPTGSLSRPSSRLPRVAACWLLVAVTPLSVEGWVGVPAAPRRSAGCNGGSWACGRGHAATGASRYRRSIQQHVGCGGAALRQLGGRRGVSCRSQATADGSSTGTVLVQLTILRYCNSTIVIH